MSWATWQKEEVGFLKQETDVNEAPGLSMQWIELLYWKTGSLRHLATIIPTFAFCLFHAGFWKLEQLCLPRPLNFQLTSNQVQGSIMMNQARLPSFRHCKVHRQYRFGANYVWCRVCSMYLYYWLAYIVLMWAESNRLCCMAVYLHVIDVHIALSYWIAFCCTGLLRPTANRL